MPYDLTNAVRKNKIKMKFDGIHPWKNEIMVVQLPNPTVP